MFVSRRVAPLDIITWDTFPEQRVRCSPASFPLKIFSIANGSMASCGTTLRVTGKEVNVLKRVSGNVASSFRHANQRAFNLLKNVQDARGTDSISTFFNSFLIP